MKMIILSPAAVSAIAVSRGTGADNLLTPDPKEVWADTTVNSAVNIDIDFGAARAVDTVFLGHVQAPAAGATWTITGGTGSYTASTIKASGALRAPDAAGQFPAVSHGFWHGESISIRYLRLALFQPSGSPPLQAGVAMAGAAFTPAYNKEWGSGRRVVDTGSVTPLPSGGFAVVEQARKAAWYWTLGDLTADEVEALHALALDRGETRPVLVVEDPAQTAGLRHRLHYGLFERLRQYERRNVAQTRWEFGIEEWV
jgi:hypothetical protein